jgi:hypothetical protein
VAPSSIPVKKFLTLQISNGFWVIAARHEALVETDLRLLQKTMGHASITVTGHIYADLYDAELDDIATPLDALDDAPRDLP